MLNRFLNVFLTLSVVSSFLLADVFMTELTDPQNSSDAGRYVELYNNGDEDVDLSLGWTVQRWTNANPDPTASSIVALSGIIEAGEFFIICNDDAKFTETFDGMDCHQDIGTGGFADSNGDDNMALVGPDGSIVDVFGVPGEDGSGTWHEFEDGRAERAEFVISGCVTPDLCELEWIIDNDSGGGDGQQYAPEGFDPGEWIGAGTTSTEWTVEAGMFYYTPTILTIDAGDTVTWDNVDGFHDVVAYDGSFVLDACSAPCLIGTITFDEPGVYEYYCSVGSHEAQGMIGTIVVEGDIQLPCEDPLACNFMAYEDCTYIADGDCDCDGNVEDCLGDCGGDAVVDDCGECGGNNDCAVNISFQVDMSVEGVIDGNTISMRISTIDGEYNPSDWYPMVDDDGDMTYKWDLPLTPGVTYGYNFNDGAGNGYESGENLEDVCAGGNYGNDRILVTPEEDTTLLPVCWESCDACPDVIEGCTDETALNYDPAATDDDGSCIYDWPETANLFFSEYAEGSSSNKYLEIYNASDDAVNLNGYSLSSCSNGCDDGVNWDYPDNVTFDDFWLESGQVYVVCNPDSDPFILAECDQEFTYLSNGDDVFALTQIGSGLVLDVIGVIGPDPGSGWDVDGISNATKDHTLVRRSGVQSGNPLWLDNVDVDGNVIECGSAGGVNDECESEWAVEDQNEWNFLGYHNMDDSGGDDCGAEGDINNDEVINILDIVALVNGIVGGYDVDCGDLNGDGVINILDIVAIVNIITSGRTTDATSAMLNNENSTVSLSADGYIGGVQMTLTHSNDFTIELTDNCMASNYVNHGNYTTLVVVEPHSELLFTANGTFEIKDLIVANSENEINVSMINEFSLSAAYPNPFNPNTSFDVSIPTAGYLSVKVYDLSGKLVNTIANGIYNQNNYTFTWDASGMPSGMYVINAEFNNSSISHNISLIK
jgi:plastocyanin